ncbi:hypothetical protein NDU88_007003 [Pleurodeles waltl]|uniref:Uncharacterized protein n=1 Tax=Pleurodeles waltl TaxID=8319 RepID=A0AAV7RST4_PLEWA|nr:hypothetical protein NDU88_007003 [Pleurodeles waltl]
MTELWGGGLLCHLPVQFKKLPGAALPIHQFVIDVLLQEWKDPNHITVPRFIAKLYPLEDMEEKMPDSVHADFVVASLGDWSSMMEENILKNVADKNVDSLLKKAHAGVHFTLRAGVYGDNVAQSLLSDFKTIFATLQAGDQCTDLLESMEQ